MFCPGLPTQFVQYHQGPQNLRYQGVRNRYESSLFRTNQLKTHGSKPNENQH
jgi:hypothetical protein